MPTGSIPVLADVKDFVREQLARTTYPTEQLNYALDGGRRMVEQEGNWYWMKKVANPNAVPGVGVYPVATVDNNGWGITKFKDAKFLTVKKPSDKHWEPMWFGLVELEEITMHYAQDSSGFPEVGVLYGTDVFIFPPVPDQAYNFKFFHWQWTNNPTSNLLTDELISRFPEALEFAAIIWAYEMELKDFQGAQYWRKLWQEQMTKIRRHNFLREQQDRLTMTPMTGPWRRMRRLRVNQNIWIGSGGYGWGA